MYSKMNGTATKDHSFVLRINQKQKNNHFIIIVFTCSFNFELINIHLLLYLNMESHHQWVNEFVRSYHDHEL